MNSLLRSGRSLWFFVLFTVLLSFTIRSSGQSPAFTNAMVGSDGLFHVQLRAVVGKSYTIEASTNLTDWSKVGAILNVPTNLLSLVDDSHPVANISRIFFRVKEGAELAFDLSFMEFCHAGDFQGDTTPLAFFPAGLDNYSALFHVQNDPSLPDATNVFFTGPAGSGLTNIAANPDNSSIGSDDANYQSPNVSTPAAAPGGTWTMNYHGTNVNFSVPNPQANSRLVIPFPTVNVSSDVLQGVSWVFKDPTTGANLAGAPAYITGVQLQLDSFFGGRIYDSPNLTPGTTSHTLSSTVNWSSVSSLYLVYDDSLGNHYVISYSKF